jgi:hypothetical protein
MWVVIVIVACSIITIFTESFSDYGDWDLVWHGIKKIIFFLLAMMFLPLVMIFGRTKERKSVKKPPD